MNFLKKSFNNNSRNWFQSFLSPVVDPEKGGGGDFPLKMEKKFKISFITKFLGRKEKGWKKSTIYLLEWYFEFAPDPSLFILLLAYHFEFYNNVNICQILHQNKKLLDWHFSKIETGPLSVTFYYKIQTFKHYD